jgi:DNA-binding GntR family transcriptional regulator
MKPSLSEQAYEIIKSEIITCTLEPGQQIAQQQLVERYQLGVTPIREALQRLALEGFVQPIPRFGYIVSPVTFSDVHEIFELRSVLESAAARLAALRGTDKQLEELSSAASFTYVYRDPQSYSDFLALNADFHRALALIAGNRRLADQISKVVDELMRVFHLGLDLRDSAEEMRDEHLALASALCDRDPDRAEQIVQSQIARSLQRVLEALTERLVGDSSTALRHAVQVELQTTS